MSLIKYTHSMNIHFGHTICTKVHNVIIIAFVILKFL